MRLRIGGLEAVFLAALAVVVALRWIGLGILPLWDPSEGRYVAIAQEMARSGDWLTPRFPDGTPFLGKPPLHFWLTAASLRMLGPSEFAARAPSAAAELVLLAATFFVGRRAFGTRTALVGTLLAATTVLGLGYSALSLTDMVFAATTAVALAAFAVACTAPSKPPSRAAGWAFFAGMGLAMLAKGPVGIAICAAAIAVWSILERNLQWRHRLPWATGTLIFAMIAAPWYLLAESANGGFLRYFLVNENLLRFLTEEYGDRYGDGHQRPYGYVWLMVLFGSLPWSAALAAPAARILRGHRRVVPASSPERFVIAWAVAAPLVFTLSRNVMLSYVLPSLPALCLVVARAISRASEEETIRRSLAAIGLASCALLAAASLIGWSRFLAPSSAAIWLGVILPLIGVHVLLRSSWSSSVLIVATALLWAGADLAIRATIRDEIRSRSSTAHLALEIERRPELAECELVFFGKLPYSASFYLSRRADALREAQPKLEEHLADERCHILVFEDKDADRFGARDTAEQLCDHGRYEVFLDRATDGSDSGRVDPSPASGPASAAT